MSQPRTVEYGDSIGGLLRGILSDLRQLVREELRLAGVEMREQAGRAKFAAACLGSAVVALAIGGIFLLVAMADGIADLLDWPLWAGYLLVALLLCAGGGIGFVTGRQRWQRVHALPEQTVRTLKENTAWIAKRLSSERK